MTALVRYEAARAALQEAHRVDEVKDLRDKAQALAAYARQANDTALLEWVTEIKVRAERRAGELLAATEKHQGGRPVKTGDTMSPVSAPTLDELGVTKKQSSRWQKLAAVPEAQFEQAVAAAKEVAGEVTTAAVIRATKPEPAQKPQRPAPPEATTPEPTPKAEPPIPFAQYRELEDRYQELVEELETVTALRDSDPAKEMNTLREQLRLANRRRDELLTEKAEMRKQLDYYQRELKKLGWKPKK